MIAGVFHEGSGLGNQLHRYVMTRVVAIDKGLEFGMINPHLFKGHSFMKLPMGVKLDSREMKMWQERSVKNLEGNEIRGYDFSFKKAVKDNTIIDGEFQGEKYYEHHLRKIHHWLKVEPLDMSNDLCVINFRGGEYVGVPDLFLPQEYWDKSIDIMRDMNPSMRFEVHTDDPDTAKEFFPDFPCIRDIGLNWRSVRYAKYSILSNSSFGILPALMSPAKKVIAPLYWAGYNKGYWQLRQNKYKRFSYVHSN